MAWACFEVRLTIHAPKLTCGANFENGGVVWLDGKRLSQVAAQAERQAVTREMPQKLKIWQCLLTGVAC